MLRPWRVTATTAICLLAAPVFAGETLDQVVLPGDRVTVTLGGAVEPSLGIAGVAGQRVTIKAKRAKGGDVSPELSLLAPGGDPVVLGKALKLTKKSATIKKLSFDDTGLWRLTVGAADGLGDAVVSVKGSSPKRHRFDGALADAGTVEVFEFGALPGSAMTLQVKSRGNPSFIANVEVRNSRGELLIGNVQTKAGKVKLGPHLLDELDTYQLRVSGGPGTFRATVKLKAPSVKRRVVVAKNVEAPPHITQWTSRRWETTSCWQEFSISTIVCRSWGRCHRTPFDPTSR